MPRKANEKTIAIMIRVTESMAKIIDDLVKKGLAKNRADLVEKALFIYMSQLGVDKKMLDNLKEDI